MVFVNFKLVIGAGAGNKYLALFVELFTGRVSALFVILAGIDITLLNNKYIEFKNKTQLLLVKRQSLLIVSC